MRGISPLARSISDTIVAAARGLVGEVIAATYAATSSRSEPDAGIRPLSRNAARPVTYRALADELGPDGITVNAYSPGIVGTDMWVEIDRRMAEITGARIGENYEKYVGGIALGRAQTPEDVAAFVSYLAGPDSDYMTGQAPMIDGGLVYR